MIKLRKMVLLITTLSLLCGSLEVNADSVGFNPEIYYENSSVKAFLEMENYADGLVIGALYKDDILVDTVTEETGKNTVLKFNKGVTGDKVKIFLWDNIESISPLMNKFESNIKVENDFILSSPLNILQPGKYGYAGQFTVEGNYIYICKQGIIYKIDINDLNNPVVLKENNYSQTVSAKLATAMQINGDYIYVGNRLSKAAYPTEEEEANLLAGAFAVLKKEDLSLVSITPLGQKVSGMSLYGNLLIVNLQMLGWAIYDVSDPETPVMLEKIEFPRGKSIETQGGEIFEHEGGVFYAVAGFGDGVRMYDVTEFYEYTQKSEKPEKVPEMTDNKLLWFYHFYSHGIGGNHTYDLTVNYPYVYLTIAAMKSQKENPDRIQGILTLDITDVKSEPNGHVLTNIANEDKNDMYTSADTEPSIICKVNDMLVVNNDNRGIAYFDIGKNAGNPEYVGAYLPYEGCCIYRMLYDEGRLFLTDGSGAKDSGIRIYMVEGFK